MRGDATASCNLGAIEGNASNVDRAVNHFHDCIEVWM